MDYRDLLVTPAFLIIVYCAAYVVRPLVCDETNRIYFFPALTAKILGALALGVVYQFYYGGGDTFMYHTYGSRLVWNALMDAPADGIKLFFASKENPGDVYHYASQIYLFRDPNSYAVIRIASFFDLFTFSTYSATACLFAVFSFMGSWQFFLTFYKQFPHLHGRLAIAAFFIPSVFFWGSGILKDSITLGCMGIATFQIYVIFIRGKSRWYNVLQLLVSLFIIFSIRKFILQAYLPAVILWIGASQFYRIRTVILRVMVVPFVTAILVGSAYYTVLKIGEDDERYAVSKLATTARITAYDIRYWSGRFAGSGYSLGELDGSLNSMVRLAPQAINVSLFRPYLWEVKNVLMLLSALESAALLFACLYVMAKKRSLIFSVFSDPNVLFTISFALVFAFAIGVSTYNFGTLVRYKVPLLPFFVTALILISDYRKRERNVERLDSVE